MKIQIQYALLAIILLVPMFALAGGKGSGGWAPPPPPPPVCNDPYYYCSGDDLYECPVGGNCPPLVVAKAEKSFLSQRFTNIMAYVIPSIAEAYSEGYYYGEGTYYSQATYVSGPHFIQTCANGCLDGACIDESQPPPIVYVPPACSVTLDKSTVAAGESTTIRWSSTNAYSMYINTIGYVSGSGSASVTVDETTDFSGIATGYSAPAGAPTPSNTTSPPPPQSNSITFSTPGTYSHTWTAPTGVTNVKVTVVGGGGGGAGGQAPDSDDGCDCILGAGGGAGGAIVNQSFQVTPGETYTVVVGKGGTGGVHRAVAYCPGTVPGEDGEDSSFETIVAHGGGAGSGIYAGGAGGTPGGSAGCAGALYAGGTSCGGNNVTSFGDGGTGGGCYNNGGNGLDGYVSISWATPSGATPTPPPSSISVSCPAMLTVAADSRPSATITTSAPSIKVGQSANLHAEYGAGTGAILTTTRIDSPEGTAVTGTSALTTRDFTFSPLGTGLYTFFARLATTKFPTLATYDSVDVEVSTNANTCSAGQYYATAQPYNGQCMCEIDNSLPVDGQCPNSCNSFAHISGGKCLCDRDDAPPVFGQCDICTVGAPVCAGPDTDGDGVGDSIAKITDAISCDVDLTNLSACGDSFRCLSGVCVNAPPSGNLRAVPGVVARGTTSRLAWLATSVKANTCAVTGSNGQSFTSLVTGTSVASGQNVGSCSSTSNSCPAGSACLGTRCIETQATAAITTRTTFRLTCTGLDNSSITKAVNVNIAPVFNEN